MKLFSIFQKSKQMGDINSLKKSLSDAKDELEKCKKASDTCKNERKNDANVLKKCKQDSKQCQDSVNNLNKLAKKAKQDGANHDECKKKLQQAENMILKTMGKQTKENALYCDKEDDLFLRAYITFELLL